MIELDHKNALFTVTLRVKAQRLYKSSAGLSSRAVTSSSDSDWVFQSKQTSLWCRFFFCLFLAQGHNIINAEIHCVSHETSHNSANCNEMKYNLPLCYNSLMSQPSLKKLRRWAICYHQCARQFACIWGVMQSLIKAENWWEKTPN